MAKPDFFRRCRYPHATGEHQQYTPAMKRCCWLVLGGVAFLVTLAIYIVL